jgi:hypothetical protein
MDIFNNIVESFTTLPPERKKLVYILSGVLVLTLIIIVLASTIPTSNLQPEIATDGVQPSVTASPEEVVAMTLAPRPSNIEFISKKDLKEFEPQFTPTPTPLQGEFYIANGQQNDLEIRYLYRNTGDSIDELRLRNNKTTEEKTIGFMYHYAPGNSAFFSRDFSQVIYIGGTRDDYNKITFYSIPKDSNVKYITLDQIKQKLSSLKTNTTAVLSSLAVSPDKSKIAFSYGDTFSTNRIAPNTAIIVIDLSTDNMKLLSAKGLVKSWKDATILQYEVNTTNPAVNNTQEISITGI